MFLSEADKLQVMTALNAYGTKLTQEGASTHIISPVLELLNRIANIDCDYAEKVEGLIRLAELADQLQEDTLDDLNDGVEFATDEGGKIITQIRWQDEEMAADFVDKLDYSSAVMFYAMLSERLGVDPDEEEIEEATSTANEVTREELARVLHGGPISTSKGYERAKDFSFSPPKPTHMTLQEYLSELEDAKTGTETY